MSYTPKNNFNLQLKRTDAGEVGFRKKLLKDVACCNKTDYQFKFEFSSDSLSAGNGIVIYVEGGCADFTWTITGSDFTLDGVTTSVRYNVIRATDATAAGVSETLTVTDSCGTAIEVIIICCDATNCCDLSDYAFTYSGDDPIELDLDIYKTLTLEGGCSPFYWLSDHEDVSFSDPRYTNQPDNRVKALAGDAYQGTLTIEDECGTSIAIGYTVCCNNPDYDFYITNAVLEILLDTPTTLTISGGCPPFRWFSNTEELIWENEKTTNRTNDITFSAVGDSALLEDFVIYVLDSCDRTTLGDEDSFTSDADAAQEAAIAASNQNRGNGHRSRREVDDEEVSLFFFIGPTDCYVAGETTAIELNPSHTSVIEVTTPNEGITLSGTNPINVTVPEDYEDDIYLQATIEADGYVEKDDEAIYGYPWSRISLCPTSYWFYEPFDSDLGVFTAYLSGGGTATNYQETAKLYVPADGGYASIYYDGFAENFPTNYTLTFEQKIVNGTYLNYVEFKTGIHWLYFSFYEGEQVNLQFMVEGSINSYELASYADLWVTWKLVVTGDTGALYRGDTLIESGLNLRDDTSSPYIYIKTIPNGVSDAITYIDEIIVDEN